MVHRQLEDRQCAAEVVFPIGQGFLDGRALEVVALPQHEIGKLDRELGQTARFPGAESRIESGHFPEKNPHRPPIRNDVMHRQHQGVLGRGRPDQQSAEQQIPGEIEGPPRFLLQPAVEFRRRGPIAPFAQIHHRHGQGAGGGDGLDRAAIGGDKVCPQNFVVPDNFIQRFLERTEIQCALHAHRLADIINGTARLQLVQEPETLLGERKRDLVVGRAAGYGGARFCRLVAHLAGALQPLLQ